ncbi:Alcohol dehydrogenase superfamily [Macleaya cordata]|uniref:Alcohol dehydrogenase superfamily n=1 Tax=Macleaya cordata TaxID=56857 RepID=A0A200QSQ1_MACCD|nr:Alcohol dehydrogenase superfamily [Macleaya cordata]
MSRLSSGESFLVKPYPALVSPSSIPCLCIVLCYIQFSANASNFISLMRLVHGGSSGIWTFSIQIAKYQGARVFVTAGNEEKLAFCKDFGADVCINYKTEDFVTRVKEETGRKGVDVILDNIGAPYFQQNLSSLNINGRLFLIGFQGGTITEVNLVSLLATPYSASFMHTGAGLRTRSTENFALIVSEVEKNVWPAFAAGKVKPVVFKSFPLFKAAEAHQLMEGSTHIGKILLIP